jgi:hypothetical protein
LNTEHPVSRPTADPSSPPAPPKRPDDVAVVERGISIVTGGGADDDVRALSERLRRVEEELDGVFETIGRLLRSDDDSSANSLRAAAELDRLGRLEDRVMGVLAEERDRISRALDDHFARIERVLTSGAPTDERTPD